MLNKRTLLVVVFCSLALSICPMLYGQATSSFSGTVSDKAGAVVSGATVRAISQATGLSREARTDDSGHYLIPLLPVGFYTIHVEAQGFGVSVYRDQAPPEKTLPYVTVMEDIAMVPDPTSAPFDHSADPPWFRETAQVDVWQQWQQKSGTARTLVEDTTLARKVALSLHGATLGLIGSSRVWGVQVTNMLRLLDKDENVVHHSITLEIHRDA